MKSLRLYLMTLLCLVAAVPQASAERDADGYPIIYLRGTFNGWSYDNASQFTREGNVYSLHLDHLDGQFKIADSSWTEVDYGADWAATPFAEPMTISCVRAGANMNCTGLDNVDIRFALNILDLSASEMKVWFAVDGVWASEPPEPGDTPVPGLSCTLPVLYLNFYQVDEEGNFVLDAEGNRVIENEVISKDLDHKNYFTGEYWLDCTYCDGIAGVEFKSVGSADEPLPLEMKARGNWTRKGFSKKPFKLKLGKKQNLLGLTPDKSKHYAILAHADDSHGYLRNFVGFNLGHRAGLPWTPSQQPLEVVINGDYRGLYFLTESIRLGDGRIDVQELPDLTETPDLISGAYLVELDNYDEPSESQLQLDEKSCAPGHYLDKLRVTFDTPEEYSSIMRRFIEDQFTAMNDLVGICNTEDLVLPCATDYDPDGIWAYLDLDDAVRYYMVREIISDVESYHGSTYLFRDRGEGQKWHFSPLWDHGNAFNGYTDCYFYDCDPFGNTWIPSLRLNAKFNEKLRATWAWFMGTCYEGLEQDIDIYVDAIRKAAVADANRWGDAPVPWGGTSVINNSDMTARRNGVISHLNAKIEWLSSQWGTPSAFATEPERDDTPAAPLPDYAQSGVENVASQSADAVASMFDLMGRPVSNPVPGSMVIVRTGSKTQKLIVR